MQSKTIFGDLQKINNYTALAKETEASFFSNMSELIRDKTNKKNTDKYGDLIVPEFLFDKDVATIN